MNTTECIPQLLTGSIACGVRVIVHLNENGTADPVEAEKLFERMRGEVEKLPLAAGEACFLLNTINDAESLVGRGEWRAARWQTGQAVLRLRSLRDEWNGDPRSLDEPEEIGVMNAE